MRGASDFLDPSGSGLAERRDEGGVSLVEILVVLALIATLSLISLPALVNLLRNFEVRKATVSMAQAFRQAQGLALKDGENYIVVVNPVKSTSSDPKFCWDVPDRRMFAIVKDVEGDCTIGVDLTSSVTACSSDDVLLESWGPPAHRLVTFAAQDATQDPTDIGDASSSDDNYKTLCFTPRGYVHSATEVGTGVYIGSTVQDMYRKIEVNRSGRVKTKRWKNGSYQD